MFDRGQVIRGWRVAIRKEFARLIRQGIYKDRFSIAELSKILGRNEDFIHERLCSAMTDRIIYHTKDKILYLDPYNNQFIIYRDGKKQQVDD